MGGFYIDVSPLPEDLPKKADAINLSCRVSSFVLDPNVIGTLDH